MTDRDLFISWLYNLEDTEWVDLDTKVTVLEQYDDGMSSDELKESFYYQYFELDMWQPCF